MRGFRTVFFSTHVDVATLAQNEQGQACKHDETQCNFPHTHFLNKKGPQQEGLSNYPGTPCAAGSTHFGSAINRWRRYPRPWFP